MEHLIKYANRKIYSKDHSKYVNLDYLEDLVNIGAAFEVRSKEDNTDITQKTLTQVLKNVLTKRVKNGTMSTNAIKQAIKG
jgi:polyhydroxyalkanoate synthesis regulator protein